jgi:hypothetical protein
LLKIDSEFKNLIPPLTSEEYQQLEKSVKDEGCRDCLIIWDGTIVDGHNRFEICSKNGIHFDTKEHQFNSREDVIEWIIRNQFGRRNLPIYERAKLVLKLEAVIRERAKANQREHGGTAPGKTLNQNSGEVCKPINTDRELAKAAGVSHDTIGKVKIIEQEATPEQKKALSSGAKKINKVYREIRPKEPKPTSVGINDNEEIICTICGIKKPSSEFYKGRGDCKSCCGYLRSTDDPEARQKLRAMSGNVVDGVDLILESMKTKKSAEADTKNICNQTISDLESIVNKFNLDINRFVYMGSVLQGNSQPKALIKKAISNLEIIMNLMEG